jgi:uncharacterized protein (DUF697 family)
MIAALSYLYGLPATAAKASLAPVVARVVGIATAASLAKFIPVLGSVTNAAVAFGLTQAVGHMTNNYLLKCAKAKVANAPTPEFIFDNDMFRDMMKKGTDSFKR